MHEEGLTRDEQRRVDAFLQLTRLERGLRKTLELQLKKADGPNWVRSLPKDIRQKIEDKGLDFADFPDLKKMIGSAWRKLDTTLLGLNKVQVLAHLEGLEGIRNDLAHSRSISKGSLSMVEAAYHVVSPLFIGGDTLRGLPPTSRPSVALERIDAAIERNGQVHSADIDVLEKGDPVRDAIEAYERVRRRPGRAPSLLNSVQNDARKAITIALTHVT